VKLWDRVQRSIIAHEGGYTDDPRDRGNWSTGKIGEGVLLGTKYGISAMSYPKLDIKNLTRDEAVAIYERDFWARIPADLPDGLRWIAFDAAVNHGPQRALEWLKNHHSVASYAATRLRFYTGISTWDVYSKGWTRRIANLLDEIEAWLASSPPTAEVVVLHGILDRPVTLRGNFVWRARSQKIDIRWVGPIEE